MAYKKKPIPIGQKFNKLIVLSEVETEERRRYVYCECECGSKKVIRYDMVKSGGIKSCGCSISRKNKKQIGEMLITKAENRRKKEKIIIENYIGKRFSKLIIQDIYRHNVKNIMWCKLICDCGNFTETSLTRLKRKHTQSCGCLLRKNIAIKFISEIDGEVIELSSSKRNKYPRLLKNKEHLHIHEAKKLYKLLNKKWHSHYIVHHIDLNPQNNKLDNLSIIDNNSKHHIHHNDMEHKMYEFLLQENLLEKFYTKYNYLKLKTLSDELKEIK